MNKNTPVILGILIILLIIGGFIYYGGKSSTTTTPYNTTSTDQTNTQTNSTNNNPQPGVPILSTSSKVAPTDTTVVVTGLVTPNGSFTNYWYEYGPTTNLGSKSNSQSVGSGYASINAPAYITGLLKDSTYYFKLVAENEYGKTAGTLYSFQTSHIYQAPVGGIPVVKTSPANRISKTSANLNGQVDANKSETQYWFEYGTTSNLGNTTAFTSTGMSNSNLPEAVTISSLNPNTTYYFRLNAQNQYGTVNGAILNFKTLGQTGASAPTVSTLSATSVTGSSATVNGTVNANGADTTFWFEFSTDTLLGSGLIKTVSQDISSATAKITTVFSNISNLDSGTTYYFRVVAQNSLGIVRGDRGTFTTK